jgi:hypothetical protein
MPELELFIAQWRRSLAETTGCTNEVLDELESHLRDEIQQLVQAGQSPEQAMARASARLGSPHTLAAEFAKVASPAPWLPVRLVLVLFTALVLVALFVGYWLAAGQNGRIGFLLAAHVCAITLGYSASFFLGLLAICYVVQRPFRDLSAGQIKSAGRTAFCFTGVAAVLTLAGILLGCVWAKDHLGRYWGWDPKEMGAACVLAWNLAMLLLLWHRRSFERMAISLGILGNIVVSLAWFAGAPPYFFTWLLLFGVPQIVLFSVGFLPAERFRRAA